MLMKVIRNSLKPLFPLLRSDTHGIPYHLASNHTGSIDGDMTKRAQLKRLSCGTEVMHAHFTTQRFSRHYHEDYAIGYMEHGAMAFRYRGEQLTAPKGHINLVIPGEAHDGHAADENGWCYRMLYLPTQRLHAAAEAIQHRANLPIFTAGVIRDPALAQQLFHTHQQLLYAQDALAQDSLLLTLLTSWIRRHAESHSSTPTVRKDPKAIAIVKAYLVAHYDNNIALDTLAEIAHISPYHLLRTFQNTTGLTPHAWLTQRRLHAAKQQLQQTKPIRDIAVDCGFADQAHLTRQYKRQFGVTPGQYRNILQ